MLTLVVAEDFGTDHILLGVLGIIFIGFSQDSLFILFQWFQITQFFWLFLLLLKLVLLDLEGCIQIVTIISQCDFFLHTETSVFWCLHSSMAPFIWVVNCSIPTK